MTPYSATRFRTPESFQKMSFAAAPIFAGNPPEDNSEENELYALDYRDYTDVDGNAFPSVKSWLGPHSFHDDNFTSLMLYNVSHAFDTVCNYIYTNVTTALYHCACKGDLTQYYILCWDQRLRRPLGSFRC